MSESAAKCVVSSGNIYKVLIVSRACGLIRPVAIGDVWSQDVEQIHDHRVNTSYRHPGQEVGIF